MRRAPRRLFPVIAGVLAAIALAPRPAAALSALSPKAGQESLRFVAAKKHLTPKEKREAAQKKQEAAQARLMHVWVLGKDNSRPTLTYSRANGDDPKISLSCQIETGLVRIVAFDVPSKGMRPGDGGRLRLSSGWARVEVAATALPNEKNPHSVDLGGITKVSPRLFSLLKNGDTVVIEVPGRTTGVSLKTLGAKVDAFQRSCLGQR